MAYKRKYYNRKKFENGGGISLESQTRQPTKLEPSYGSGYSEPSQMSNFEDYSSGNNQNSNTDFESIASYASLGLNALGDSFNTDASPKTAEDKYIYGQVQENSPGSSYEDASYAITDLNPISSAFHTIGAGANDLLAPTNEEGYSDSSNFAIGLGGMIDPGSTTDQAIQSLSEGDVGTGIAELLIPGYASINQNNEAEATANKAKKEYRNQKLFNELYDFSNTNQYDQSTYGNTYQMKMGGNMSSGGSIQKESLGNAFQSPVNSIDYYGPTHEQGGIPLGNNTEVEDMESKHNDYIFSNSIPYTK